MDFVNSNDFFFPFHLLLCNKKKDLKLLHIKESKERDHGKLKIPNIIFQNHAYFREKSSVSVTIFYNYII